TWTAVVPFIVMFLNSVFSMGRAPLISAILLFCTSFFATPHRRHFQLSKLQLRVGLAVALLIAFGGVVLVGQMRGLGLEYSASSVTMDKIADYIPIAPSVYFYVTGPIAG